MARRYKDAAARLQQNVQKHLKDMKDLSSSEDEEPYEPGVVENMFRGYRRGGDSRALERTQHLLQEAVSGRSVACLVCISSVRRAHAAWACAHCYASFHLACIQQWGADSVSARSLQLGAPISLHRPQKVEWCCPKCRHSYSKEEIPRKYRCFCGKTDNPPVHPWLIPHSCGEVCEKKLSAGDDCRHKCLLLCHPGPCPPCPQTVNGVCYCENEQKKVRCSAAKWSCGHPCQKTLLCQTHKCELICHEGECPPCTHSSLQPCRCGAEKAKRPCDDPFWQCKEPCNKPYSCGFHKCEKVCHPGSCEECPNSGMRSCPCGANQKYVQCPDTMETCLGTCGSKHEECEHGCPEKCHKGACPPCQVMIQKKCQCGSHTRSLPCSKEYKCDTKCKGTRPCGKHSCARKCCNGNCPPCEKACDKPLQCGRHKCTTICHHGPCYPCPLESKVTCKCKETYVMVPCGRERFTRPPKCSLSCKLKYKCGHLEQNKHSCHFGDCPPCKAICHKTYPKCGHECKAICHQYKAVVFKQIEKPATPWDIQPPKTKIMTLECPPCSLPVSVVCFGEHETDSQPCHAAARRACGRRCGRALACGNHRCALLCHLMRPEPDYPAVPSECRPCSSECARPRPALCVHACPLRACHRDPCPPCTAPLRPPCHCALSALYLRCAEFCAADEDMLSCKQQCPRSLACGHRCRNVCHSGPCADQLCTKKAKIHCPCANLKKEAPCDAVRNGSAKIECDDSCEAKKAAAKLEKEKEHQRRERLEEERNKRELAEYEWKLSGKKKKYKEKKVVIEAHQKSWVWKYWMAILAVLVVIVATVYYSYLI